MSLLDDVSIVVTPNGYKAGELYAVVPVPTEGAEEVVNGDFATDSDWSFGGTTFSAGAILLDSANDNVFQGWTDTINTLYKLTITKTGSGTIRFRSGFAGSAATKIEIPESGIIYFTSTSDTNRIQIYGDENSINATLNSVSVKEYTAADMDVTRATAATRVDEAGLVNYAEIIGSEEVTNGDFSNGATDWTITAGATITDVATISTTGSMVYISSDSTNLVNGKSYNIKLTAKRLTGTGLLAFTDNSGNNITGTPLIDSDGELTYLFTAQADITGFGFKRHNSGTYSWELDNISVKEVTRDNVPRIDYSGGGCPHILAEPLRTNLIPYSEDFSQWFKIGSPTLTSNYGVSPDGTQNSTRLQMSTTNKIFATVSASGNISFTVYLKGTGQIRLRDNTSTGLQDVTLTNEWVRYELNFNATISNFQIEQQSGTSDLEIFGTQLEEGSYATSYIPTSGSTVTRNQDQFTRDGIGSLINSTEGVLFLEVAALSDDGTNRYFSVSDGTTSNYIYFRFVSTSNTVLIRTAVEGNTINTLQKAIADTTAFNKYAFKWKSGDYAFWINGIEVLTDSSSTVFGSNVLNQIEFSFPSLGGGGSNSKVKQLQVYKTALTDTQLTSLTE